MANIYIGNLPYSATPSEVQEMFTPFGCVKYVKIVTDHETGRSMGYGFVDMETTAVATAIAALNETELAGRRLVVNEARPKPDRSHGAPRSPSEGYTRPSRSAAHKKPYGKF